MTDTGSILVFGAAGIDTLAHAALEAKESVPGTIINSPGGVACNIAINLARLGVPTCLVSRIGDDDDSHRLVRALSDTGVDTHYLERVEDASTARYVAMLDADGDLRMAVSSMNIIETLSPSRVLQMKSDLDTARAIVADTNLTSETLTTLLGTDVTALRCVDTVSAAKAVRVADSLEHVDILKTTPVEASALTGIHARRIDALCDALLARGVNCIYLSRGADGLCVASSDGLVTLPAIRPDKLRSTSGAGDALMAGIVLGHLSGEDIVSAGELGLAAASLTLTSDTSTLTALTRELLTQTRTQHAIGA
ncbi:MAG: PfkB family carbohydrate kinase [Pseudomonadota bacterium]